MNILNNRDISQMKSAKYSTLLVIALSLLLVLLIPGFRTFACKHPGLIAVLVGVSGEVYFDWREERGPHSRAKKFFMALLVVGLTYELYEASETDKEAAEAIYLAGKANERASADELESARLRREIAGIDPLKKPIVSISAIAKFTVKCGCFSNWPPSEMNFGGIYLFENTNLGGPQIGLRADPDDINVTRFIPAVPPHLDEKTVIINFHESPLFDRQFFGLWTWDKPAGFFNDARSFALQMPQLGSNVHVLEGGTVEIFANSLHWTIPIPPQIQKWGLITAQTVTNRDNTTTTKVFETDLISPIGGQKVGHFDGK